MRGQSDASFPQGARGARGGSGVPRHMHAQGGRESPAHIGFGAYKYVLANLQVWNLRIMGFTSTHP